MKFEFEEEKFQQGFRSCVLDVGITLYSGRAGPDLIFGCSGPQLKKDRILAVLKNLFCPFPDLLSALRKIQEKKGERAGIYETVFAAVVGILLYYTGWLLVCLDWIPVPEGGYNTFGVHNGTYNIVDERMSNRYGYFRLYTNEWKAGEVLTKSDMVSPAHHESIAVGDRIGSPMHLLVFGWFFIFCFIMVVTTVRSSARDALKIKGNSLEDLLCSLFLWPTVLVQVNETLDNGPEGSEPLKNNTRVEESRPSEGSKPLEENMPPEESKSLEEPSVLL